MNSSLWNPKGHWYQTLLFGYNHSRRCQKLTWFTKGLKISTPQRNKVRVPEYSWIAATFPLLTSTWTQGIYARQSNVKFQHTAGNVKRRRWNCISCCQGWEQIACKCILLTLWTFEKDCVKIKLKLKSLHVCGWLILICCWPRQSLKLHWNVLPQVCLEHPVPF